MKRSIAVIAVWALVALPLPVLASDASGDSGNLSNDDGLHPLSRTVHAIVSYTKWPSPNSVLTLCQLGPSSHGGDLRHSEGNFRYRMLARATTDFTGCHIVYLGQLTAEEKRRATSAVMDQGILTIEESYAKCVARAMVCIRFERSTHRFDLNLDSIARSGLQVSPRILRLSMGGRR